MATVSQIAAAALAPVARRLLNEPPPAPAAAGASTLTLRVIALFCILASGALGILPPALIRADEELLQGRFFSLLKSFAAGLILCLGFVHVFGDAVHDLEQVSDFPLAGTIAAAGVFFVFVIEQAVHEYFRSVVDVKERAHDDDDDEDAAGGLRSAGGARNSVAAARGGGAQAGGESRAHLVLYQVEGGPEDEASLGAEGGAAAPRPAASGHGHGHSHGGGGAGGSHHGRLSIGAGAGAGAGGAAAEDEHQHTHTSLHNHAAHGATALTALLRQRRVVIAHVLEIGIVVHSFIIGVNLGVDTDKASTVTGLLIALCFHQFFEGLGLGASLAQARLPASKISAMAAMFVLTTPLGVAIGIAVSSSYPVESLASLVVRGVFNALSAGVLIYLALVDLMAEEFSRADLQSAVKRGLRWQMVGAMLAGGAFMTLLAMWA